MPETEITYPNNNHITLQYNTNNEPLCLYINRLDQMLSNQTYNIYTIEKMLNTVISSNIKDINFIKNNLKNSINKLESPNTSLKDTLSIAKVLANDFNRYHNLLSDMNQINTIVLEGLDQDRIIELMDSINDDKNLLRDSLDDLSNEYKRFFEKSNEEYNKLNQEHKNYILITIKNIVNKENENNNVIQESVMDAIFGFLEAPISITWGAIKRYWYIIVVALGIDWFLGINVIGIIFKALSRFASNTLIVLGLILGISLIIWVYHHVYDYIHIKANEELSAKLDQVNQNSQPVYMTGKIPPKDIRDDALSISKEVPQSFQGFDNSASYKPDDSLNKTDDKYNIF